MTKELITVQPDELMTVVDRIFKTHKIHHIPVIEADGTVIGMISKSDYLRTLHSLSLFKTAKVLEVTVGAGGDGEAIGPFASRVADQPGGGHAPRESFSRSSGRGGRAARRYCDEH